MKEVMEYEWRTVQLFLEDEGVCEVEVETDQNAKVRCSCSVFAKSAKCKHSKYVRKVMNENDGFYNVQIELSVDDDAVMHAMRDPKAFREFIIKYGKVEVID